MACLFLCIISLYTGLIQRCVCVCVGGGGGGGGGRREDR